MELVILSGPGVEVPTTASDVRAWAIAGLVCAAILLADAAVTAFALRRNGSPRWPLPVLLPALLSCACLVFAWRTWLLADSFPMEPRYSVTGECALCRTENSYGAVGVLVMGASLLVLLGSVLYLLGEVD